VQMYVFSMLSHFLNVFLLLIYIFFCIAFHAGSRVDSGSLGMHAATAFDSVPVAAPLPPLVLAGLGPTQSCVRARIGRGNLLWFDRLTLSPGTLPPEPQASSLQSLTTPARRSSSAGCTACGWPFPHSVHKQTLASSDDES
jgi:hypothetical protein